VISVVKNWLAHPFSHSANLKTVIKLSMENSMPSLSQRVGMAMLLIPLLLTACGTSRSAAIPTETPAPTATSTSTPTSSPTATLVTIPQALFCVAVNTPTPAPGCEIPTGQERDRYCAKKIPYTLVAIAPDVSYEVITPNFTCTDAGVRGGKRLLVCSGLQSFTFQVRVCQPGCVIATPMQSGPTGFCTSGYNYDPANQCCAAPPTDANGCVTLKFDTRACGG